MRSARSRLKTIAAATAVFMTMVVSCIQRDTELLEQPTSLDARTTVEMTLPLSEQWRRTNISLPYFRIPSGVLASGEFVYFVDYETGHTKGHLRVLDASSGIAKWEVTGIPRLHSMVAGQKILLIAVDWEIRAYDFSNGELLWHSERLPDHTSYLIYPVVNGEVLVYSVEDAFNRREQVLRYYDIQNGSMENTIRTRVLPDSRMVLISSYAEYWIDDDRLWATDKNSDTVLWQVAINGPVNSWPIQIDSILVFSFYNGIFSELWAVNATTGVLKWRYEEETVSNFALYQGAIYAIRVDGALVGIDPRTGQEVGHVSFAPTETETGTRKTAYWVTASDDMIFVYFGDSKELIAFSSAYK